MFSSTLCRKTASAPSTVAIVVIRNIYELCAGTQAFVLVQVYL